MRDLQGEAASQNTTTKPPSARAEGDVPLDVEKREAGVAG
jgi:hypothetical protein